MLLDRDESNVWAFDPELAPMASEAAVELDSLLTKQHFELGPVRRLGAVLRRATTRTPDQSLPVSLEDPSTAAFLGSTLAAWEREAERSLEKVQERFEDIAAVLEQVTPGSDPQTLKNMRGFCLVLSRVATAYQAKLQEHEDHRLPEYA